MRIVHFFDSSHASRLLSDFVDEQVASTDGHADVVVASTIDSFRQALKEKHPDIVHLHGCWNRQLAKASSIGHSEGSAVVISPHWALMRYSMHNERYVSKFFKSLFWLLKVVHGADALLVTTDRERDEIVSLGWKKRVDVVKAALLDETISEEEMGRQTLAFYTKVIDSRYRLLMTPVEDECVYSLLRVGEADDDEHNIISSSRLLNLRALKPAEWRRIMLYSDDEDIREIIDRSIDRMQLNAPEIDTSKISRYPLHHQKQKGPLDDKDLLTDNILSNDRIEDEVDDDEPLLRRLLVMLMNARYLAKKRKMSLRHLAELYRMIKYADYDEQRLNTVTRHMKVRKFTRRMLDILSQRLLLEEGFMPMPPLRGRKTRKLSQAI